MKLAFVLGGLGLGGAEMMLWKLVSRLDRDAFDVDVIAFSGGSLFEQFLTAGISCRVINPLNVAHALRVVRPDVVQGWLHHGNIAAAFVSRLFGLRVPVLWSIRGTLAPEEKLLTRIVIRSSSVLATLPTKIIYNSVVTAVQHEHQLGYSEKKRLVLPNGFDTDLFRPSQSARATLRTELNLGPDTILVGSVGRYHAVKGQDYILRAAKVLSAQHPNVHYAFVGEGMEISNHKVTGLIAELGIGDRVHLLGSRADVHNIAAATDIFVLASTAEGFPNVVGEAMSCAVPCIVSDVGDSAAIVESTGRAVAPRDVNALAAALSEFVAISEPERRQLGLRARQRIVDHYSIDTVVRRYEAAYSEIYHAHASQA